MDLSRIEGIYSLIKTEYIDEIKSTGLYFKHNKSGARVCVLSNDDNNKVFSIAFRTPPSDSTGVAHILEHSVLCGSDKFPVKDPFIELAKGSLNTFLNAMTYPDKTVYPVASYNDKDFDNLCDIYMDAVLHPNIYKHPEIFLQEGWRYEFDENGEMTVNGVVYNEMKGVFSSPEQILNRALSTSLFPDTPYGKESGGDPEDIPSLSYEDFLNFHKTYYHPSNSYISLYGDMDYVKKLVWLDEEYLSAYDEINVDSAIPYQDSFADMEVMELNYPIVDDDGADDKNYLAYNAVYGSTLDDELCIAMDVLSYCLIDSPSATLKKKLLGKKICKDVFGGSNNGILQPYFTVAIKDSSLSDGKQYANLIKETLKEIVEEGIDPVSINAAISRFEFSHREACFDSLPKGLVYLLNMLDGWLYKEDEPFAKLYENHIYERLKEKAGTGYFEEIIRKYIIDGTHESVVVLTPDMDYNSKAEKRLAEKINEIKDKLTSEELERIKENGRKLKVYQEKTDTKEELACIPRLKREDLSDKIIPVSNVVNEVAGIKTIYHKIDCNGISYIDLYFDLGNMDEKLVPYLGLFEALFASIRTGNYSLSDLNNEIDLNTGGITCEAGVLRKNTEGSMYYFRIGTKVLKGKAPKAMELISEIALNSDYSDEQQLMEIIMEVKSRLAMEIMGAGHQAAVRRCSAAFDSEGAFVEMIKGISFYDFVYELENDFEGRKTRIIAALNEIVNQIFSKNNLVISITCDKENLPEIMESVELISGKLEDEKINMNVSKLNSANLAFTTGNEGIKLPGRVSFVSKCGCFEKDRFTGALSVLKTILSYEFLWKNVREQGGAYGCMCNFLRNGRSFFVSYRDPNLDRTLEVYDKVLEYIANFEADEEEMTKFIIGTISSIDAPMTPSIRGRRDMINYLSEISDEERLKAKMQILKADSESIRNLKNILGEVMGDSRICVLGDGKKIDECKDLFDSIMELKM